MGVKTIMALLGAFLAPSLAALTAMPACAAGLEGLPVSVQCQANASLAQCLEAVGAACGVPVACAGCPETASPVQNRFDGSLKDVLGQVAERFELSNYTMDFNDATRQVVIRMLGAEPAQSPAQPAQAADAQPQKPAATDGAAKNVLDQEVVPPATEGGAGVTLREVSSVPEKNLLNQGAADPQDDIVIPSPGTGEPGVTARELEALREKNRQEQGQVDPLDQEVFPPSEEGNSGLTQRQIDGIREKNRQTQGAADPLDQDVFPPSSDGGPGLTQRQLNDIRAKMGFAPGQATPVANEPPPPLDGDRGAALPSQ